MNSYNNKAVFGFQKIPLKGYKVPISIDLFKPDPREDVPHISGNTSDPTGTDLFEGVHFGGEVGGFEHPQQSVQPQVIHHSHQLPLEPHTQQLDG